MVKKKTDVTRQALKKVYDAHGVVLEEISSQMQGLAEAFASLDERLAAVERQIDELSEGMQFVKEEISLIRRELKAKTNTVELSALERRVKLLEKKVAA